jgi:hypothetical protein
MKAIHFICRDPAENKRRRLRRSKRNAILIVSSALVLCALALWGTF